MKDLVNSENSNSSGQMAAGDKAGAECVEPPPSVTGDNRRNMTLDLTQVVSESEDEVVAIPGLSEQGGEMHCKIVNAFTKAFAKQNVHFEKAIQSLDALNDQLIAFIFSPESEALHLSATDLKNGEAKHQEAVKGAITLMRRLLLDAQSKFRKMVEENKSLGGRLDVDLQSAHQQMALLRAELTDTNRRLNQMNSPPSTPSTPSHYESGHQQNGEEHTPKSQVNGLQPNNGHHSHPEDFEDPSPTQSIDLDNLSPAETRKECERLLEENRCLRRKVKELRASRGSSAQDYQTELQHAKEALSALKGDRKRLKAEKFELLNQMKQLYVTLEDKEKELRDFIRNYEQRMRESEAAQLRLVAERDDAERERWSILRHARDEAERGLSLATQLNLREAQVQQLQEELHEGKRQLSQYGIYAEPDRSTSTNATSHYSLVSSLTATYATLGDRGSSADSGVRLSSDRDSGGGQASNIGGGNLSDSANEALSLDMGGDGSGDGDSMSVISTATLPQLFATPRDSPGPISFSSLTRSLDANALSRSAEQLLAAEAAEARRKSGRRSGSELSGRASTGAKGAWGSISRVFARNKHRRTLDPSLYDSMNAGQRSSWSPQSSVPASPLTEQESYADKLRALEEAASLPMELWRAGMVQAWIEVSLGMQQYGSRCGDNVKSGKVLLELADAELESELGISHPLHRKKLRLAIEEHRNPALVRFPCIVELSHVWVSSEWLPDIGLPQYAEHFAGCLVDARLLDHLSKKDLEKYLGVTRKFHLASIAHGVHLLRMVAYDRQNLAERRRQCDNDPLVWTNQHFVQWARSIDLNEYAENLKGSGVNGAFAVLEPSFNGDTLASAMGIPQSKQIIRRHLGAELDALLNPARSKITQQYRVTKSRFSTLEKQRSDSLGRSSALNTEAFRRSTEENRRRTSLRAYSLLFAQKGSLSRALGLKLKQDLQQQRHLEQDEGPQLQHRGNGSWNQAYAGPPPLPPGLPGKLLGYNGGGSTTQSLNGDAGSPLHHVNAQQPRPQSVMTLGSGSKGLLTPGEESSTSASEETSEASRELVQNHKTEVEVMNNHKGEISKKHQRIRSIGGDAVSAIETAHISVHTPV